ncbi:MAG: gliding motility-associated C-terminal domain-containing protein [Chitinophagales bacterium]
MKKNLLFLLLLPSFLLAQNAWIMQNKAQKCFIENQGQFQEEQLDPILFAFDGGAEFYYFTKTGVSFKYVQKNKVLKSQEEKDWRKNRKTQGFTKEEFEAFERKGQRLDIVDDLLQSTWINANTNLEIVAELPNNYYHSYSFYENNGKIKDVNQIPSYQKLTYKNIYPNIDIEYIFHESIGLKYNIILHPGADPKDIQLSYSRTSKLLDDGSLRTPSLFGEIIDHAPFSFYEDDKEHIIPSAYIYQNNRISFELGNFNPNKKIIIDPWIQTPAYNLAWDCVWECETDASGNTYTIGGIMPMVLNKYNAAGSLVWTYNTPYDTTDWLGTFATDDLGNSYLTLGSTAKIQKISPAGAVLWNNNSPGGFFSSMEFWNIEFNCDQSKLIIAGTGGTLPPLPYIYDMNLATGNITASVEVPNNSSLAGIEEVRSITACGNGNYYYMTHKQLGYINQNFSLCGPNSTLLSANSGTTLGYKCENWRVNNTGIEAIAYYDDYVFVNRANQLQKRKFSDASIVATANIPNGDWNTGFGGNNVGNSGIVIDDCGNIYVGSVNSVIKYDQNLNQLAIYNTSINFNVYDVELTSNGNIIAAGSTGSSSSNVRQGYVESFDVAACAQIASICCDPTICPVEDLCLGDPAFTLTSSTPGGLWSGPGIVNTSTGLFDPAIAGQGVFNVVYTLACGSDTTEITINDCSALSVCAETNGDLSVSGGTAPFSWSSWAYTGQVCTGVVVFGNCIGGVWQNNYAWVGFGAGSTVTPPVGADSIQVIDNAGTVYTIFDIDTVSPCDILCDASINPAGPFCQNDAAINLSAVQSGGTWSGSGITNASLGTFNPSLANPSNTITYTLGCGASQSINILVNANALSTDTRTACASFTWIDGITYTSSNNSATFTIAGGAANGCDSIVTLDLTIQNAVNSTDSRTACGSFTWIDGLTYTSSNNSATFTIAGGAANGCDSIITLDLTIQNAVNSTDTRTACGSFTWIDGLTYTSSNNSATFTIAGGASNGCDSIITLDLTIQNAVYSTDVRTACGSFTWIDGLTYTSNNNTASFTIVGGASGGCDSIINLDLSFNPAVNSIDLVSTCGSYTWIDGLNYTSSNNTATYTIPGGAASGCDSIISLNLTINSSVNSIDTRSACGSFTWIDGVTYTSNNNTASFTIPNGAANACDSIITLNLSFNGAVNGTDVRSACGSFTWIDGLTYTSSNNTATFTMVGASVGGCDSIVNLNLTIYNAVNSIDTRTACGSFTWIDGLSYSSNNNTASFTIPGGATNGCDSIVTLNLSIQNAVSSTDIRSACDSLTWIDGLTYTSNNNTASYTIVGGAAAGCDSIVSLNLTIQNSTSSTDTRFACDSLTWIDGISYTSSNNTSSFTIPGGASSGCDSIVYLDLIISNSVYSTDTRTACESFTWIDGITYTANNNTATYILSNGAANACDSVLSLNLTITNNITVIDQISACGSYTWLDGNTYTTSNNTASLSFPGAAANGCDSLLVLDLSILAEADASILTSGPHCEEDAYVQLQAVQAGGIWSGLGIIDSINGIFDPSLALGINSISYFIPGTCGDTSTIDILVNTSTEVDAGEDTSILAASSIVLSPSIFGSEQGIYSWSPSFDLSCADCLNPIASPTENTSYTFSFTNSYGCESSDEVLISLLYPANYCAFPTAFSPNGDLVNNVYRAICNEAKSVKLRIYNRWGELVFENELISTNGGWDGEYKGKKQEIGVYSFVAEIEYTDGKTETKTGNLTLIR